MKRLFGWIRIGLIDLRGDMRRFGILIACLALGTGVIAAVGSVGAGFVFAVERDATSMMGGDLEAARPDRKATAEELAYLQTLGEIAMVIDTTARGLAGENTVFLDLLSVGENYPLRGDVISPQLPIGEKPAPLLALKEGAFGAIVDAVLLDRLAIEIGDRFTISNVDFEVRGTLNSVPDSAVRGFQLGLTTMISTTAFDNLGDLRAPLPGLLTHYRYKIILDELSFDDAKAAILENFTNMEGASTENIKTGDADSEEWAVRSPRDAAGDLVHFYDLFSRFLMIVGLASLLVGGVGVYNGVSAYIGERQRSIATLRSLGATNARIMVHFLTQIAVLSTIGVTLGVVFGAITSQLLLPFVGNAININLASLIDAKSLIVAAGFGFLAAFAFSYLPLISAQLISPASLFRSPGSTLPKLKITRLSQLPILLPVILAGAAIFWLAIITTSNILLVSSFGVGVLASFLLLRFSGWLLQKGLKALPSAPFTAIRNALRNIYHAGSSAPVVIVSIGMGLAMLLVIALLNNNLYSQLLGAVSRDAPTFVALDIFPDEVEDLQKLAESEAIFARFETNPMLLGSVSAVNGVARADIGDVPEEAAFLLSGEIPLTWQRQMPRGTTAIEGEWWPEDYSGNALISLRSSIKSQLNVEVGDIIEFTVFGDKIEATIANFREYQWQNGINFMVTFSPGQIQAYPFNSLGAIKAEPGQEKNLERILARTMPDISFISVGDALNQVASILSKLGAAVNVVGGLAVINGLLVLAGTMAAGRKQRESDAVIQKVLGATRGDVIRVFVLEYGLLGAFAAIIASVVGMVAAWAITVTILEVDFSIDALLIIMVVIGAVLLTIATGAATTWRALSSRPAQVLRSI